MKIIQTFFLPDFIEPIKHEIKRLTRRPLKVQPVKIVDGWLFFGEGDHQSRIREEDMLCPYGEPGQLMQCFTEGNGLPFHEAKIREVRIEHLSMIKMDDITLEGCSDLDEFLETWDKIYGETDYATFFDPVVWVVKF